MRFTSILIITLAFLIAKQAVSQDRCSIIAYEDYRKANSPGLPTKKDFENWMQQKILQQKLQSNSTQEAGDITYTIPVVFHIVHKGEAVGSGTNIPDEQIFSQIKVMNEDFQRLNADASATPDEFKPVAGSMSIKFILARQDPNGAPTNGIVRVRGSKTTWSVPNPDDALLKSQSYWPAENYLNIWVCDMTGGLIGYAQFPQSNQLPGLEEAPDNRLTDGVIADFTTVGSINDGDFVLNSRFNLGRTITHEVAHFLGLRHIWGDDDGACSASDYVSDTPNQANSTSGCPSHPRTSCSSISMFQNYLDYTNDACMNLFTLGQVERMTIVLNNSPRRASLLSSPGARDPGGNTNLIDLALLSVSNPMPVTCELNPKPIITVRNNGTIAVTSVKANLTVNNTTKSELITTSLLPVGGEGTFTLNTITLNEGANEFKIELTEPNASVDQNPLDNTLTVKSVVNRNRDIIPLRQSWETTFSPEWSIVSQGGFNSWTTVGTNLGRSIGYTGFNNPAFGRESWLASPILDFSKTQQASLFFDVSYATTNSRNERLKVLVSKDCGTTYEPDPLYFKAGSQLATGTATNSWLPSMKNDWRREYINLSEFAGEKNLRIAFVVVNSNGNNVYVDNLEFFVSDDPDPVIVNELYSLYYDNNSLLVTFNLAQRQDVRMQVYNLTGQLAVDNLIYDVLNQTYTVDLPVQGTGIYLVRMQIGSTLSSKKVLIRR